MTTYRQHLASRIADLSRRAYPFTQMNKAQLEEMHACGYPNWRVMCWLIEAVGIATNELVEETV